MSECELTSIGRALSIVLHQISNKLLTNRKLKVTDCSWFVGMSELTIQYQRL